MKLVVNMMMGSMMATTAEGLALAAAVGLKQQDLIKVIELGTMAMPMFKLKVMTSKIVARMVTTAYPAGQGSWTGVKLCAHVLPHCPSHLLCKSSTCIASITPTMKGHVGVLALVMQQVFKRVVGMCRLAQAPTMVKGEYPVAFPLKHQQKDIRLALEEASEAGLKLPVAAAANKLYMEVRWLCVYWVTQVFDHWKEHKYRDVGK